MAGQPTLVDSRYLDILDALDAVVYVADLDTYEILFLNRKARETSGAHVGGICWRELQKDQRGPCPFCTNSLLLNAQGEPNPPYVWEFQNTLNGEWWECRDQALTWSDGRRVRLEIATNITLRKSREDAWNQAEEKLEKYRKIVSATDDKMSYLDRGYVYQVVNDAYLEAHHKDYDAIVGHSVEELVGAEAFQTQLKPNLDRCLAGEKIRYQAWFDFPGNGPRFMDVQYIPDREADGTVAGIIVSSHDLTELKEAQRQQERLLQAIDQSGELVVITDAEARIEYVNPAFERITGYSFAEVIGRNPRILRSGEHDADFYQRLWQHLSHGKTWQGRFRNKKKDGSIYTEAATISPVLDEKGAIVNYVAAKRDITEQLEKDQQLQQFHKMEAIGTLAAGVAHNFNNFLAVVLGSLEMARIKADQPHRVKEYVEQGKTACMRARDLVRKLLAYSRQDETWKKELSIAEIIEETLSLLSGTLPGGIMIERKISPESSRAKVMGNAGGIQECLINLCNNAANAMGERGALTILLDLLSLRQEDIPRQYTARPGTFVRLRVKDTGCGMDRQVQERAFDAFYTTRSLSEGTGLGLSSVQGIVYQHQGLIKLYSTPGRGTTFDLYFPVSEMSAAGTEITEPDQLQEIPNGSGTVLLVEDDPLVAGIGRDILLELGYQPTVMTDSREALDYFRTNSDHFQLLISDYSMPGLSGLELIREIRRIRPDLPTVLCTGHIHLLADQQVAQAGINACCAKPLELSKLAQTLNSLLPQNS